jgi:hypothetical protein
MAEGIRQGQCSTENPERVSGREDTLEGPGMKKWNKEPKLKAEATSEEGKENRQRHQTAITSGKQNNTRQDFQEDRRNGDRQAKSRIFRQDSKNERLDIVEGSTPSETRNEATSILRADHSRNFW